MFASMAKIEFKNKKESGLYCIKLWLKNESLIKTMVDNRLFGLLYDSIIGHKDALKVLYGVDYNNNPDANYFVYFLVAIIFTSFAIFYREKGKRTIEEVLVSNNKILAEIMQTSEIGK